VTKYARALENLNELRLVVALLWHKMAEHPLLQHHMIIYNFPLAGFYSCENDGFQID